MLQRAEHVAAPQQEAATDHRVAALGSTSSGMDSKAPISRNRSRGDHASAQDFGIGSRASTMKSLSGQAPRVLWAETLMDEMLGSMVCLIRRRMKCKSRDATMMHRRLLPRQARP